ncbi:hypothetical protein [Chryseobacterium sp. JM1]|uniref:hypothetical protein n=1 Tax=Chryseobacterium sp. JM1 TaxID=1233950 RepID=UPI0004E63E10|nr:hypothetical protein [Chryseobacterium sp. JM1]KFF16190.1 hypothetical protein IW22_23115 [Chryseobacterium sp. JM1]
MNHDGNSFSLFFLCFDVFQDKLFLVKNFSFMLNIFLLNDPADKRSVRYENEGYDNCYGNNYKDQQANI